MCAVRNLVSNLKNLKLYKLSRQIGETASTSNCIHSRRGETGSRLGHVGTVSLINYGDNVNITGRTKMSKDFRLLL